MVVHNCSPLLWLEWGVAMVYIAKRNIFQGEPLEAVLSDYNIWNLKNGIILHAVLELSFQFH